MAKERLNARIIAKTEPGSTLEDGAGLRLVISKSGAKRWVLRYTFNGKRREMGLGSVSLPKARKLAQDARDMIVDGIDPLEARRIETIVIPTFTSAAASYIKAHRHEWRNRKHARQWASTLKTYVRPVIGAKKVDSITTEDILKILTPIWNDRTETATRVRQRIENILDYCSARKWRDSINPARWRGHLDKLLAKPTKIKRVKHHPAMPYEEVSDFMNELKSANGNAALALRFLILTATRTNEVLKASWCEINLDAATWTIPGNRMKAGKPHTVPLSNAALEILRNLSKGTSEYVFPGAKKGRPLSSMALLTLMRRLGYGVNGNRGDYVPHGFRSSFRDWSGEVSVFPHDVCEMALAHAIKNQTEAAYRRGDMLQKRRLMMQQWADYIGKRPVVVPINKALNG